MKIIVIYDSVFGNTQKIAQAIGSTFGADAQVISVKDARPDLLPRMDMLIVGSPTRRFRATPATMDFLRAIPQGSLKGVKVTAFDTRLTDKAIASPIFRQIVKWAGYAAKPIAKALQAKGGTLFTAPQGFGVDKSEGPLADGELERAAQWLKG